MCTGCTRFVPVQVHIAPLGAVYRQGVPENVPKEKEMEDEPEAGMTSLNQLLDVWRRRDIRYADRLVSPSPRSLTALLSWRESEADDLLLAEDRDKARSILHSSPLPKVRSLG